MYNLGMNFLKSDNFPNEKTLDRGKYLGEIGLKVFIDNNLNPFPPLRLEFIPNSVQLGNVRMDGMMHARWKNTFAAYGYTFKASTSPQVLRDAIDTFDVNRDSIGLLPLIIVPYLSDEHLAELDEKEISGIDLCGNGLLLSPEFRVLRTGLPNLYKDTRPIRNPFGGDSSVFARAFLLDPEYASLSELRNFAIRRVYTEGNLVSSGGAFLSLGTASKVIKSLAEELVVSKNKRGLVLQDPGRLLSLLRLGYRPLERPRIMGRTALTNEDIWASLESSYKGSRFVATGMYSASRYKVLSGVEKISLYVDDLKSAVDCLELVPGKAFANIELIEDRKNLVYFDARAEGNAIWASPIQTWLELATGGSREQEAALGLETLLAHGKGANLP